MRAVRSIPGVPRRRRRVLAGVGALAIAIGTTGCGEQAREVREANAYVERVNGVQQRFARDLQQLSGPIAEATTVPQVQRETRRFQRAIEGTQGSLQAIRPPTPLRASHRRLVNAYGTWSTPLRTFRTALRERDRAAILEAKSRFSTATTQATVELRAASTQINERVGALSD